MKKAHPRAKKQPKMRHSEDIRWNNLRSCERLLGKPIDSYFGIGRFVKMGDGFYGIRMRMYCWYRYDKTEKKKCNRWQVAYLRRGAAGPDHCVYNYKGKFVGDLRDQVYVCPDHKRRHDGVLAKITRNSKKREAEVAKEEGKRKKNASKKS